MLLLSGDVQPNPGPATRGGRTPKYPCTVCSGGVRSNSKAISCDVCEVTLIVVMCRWWCIIIP